MCRSILKKKNPTSFTVAFLRANLSNLVGKMVIPAGFEPTACRLGGDRSILLSYGTIWLKPFIFKAVSVSDDDIFITISANIGVIFVLASC